MATEFGASTEDGKLLGINTRCYPCQLHLEITVTCVLVAGIIGDYAAYAGCGSPSWVARHGTKLSFTEAKIHFPTISKDRYRS